MPSAFDNFLRENTKGPVAKIAMAAYIRDIATADNKWKAVLKSVRDLALFRIAWPIALLGTFTSMGRAVRSILHDTGSLESALRRMATIQGLQRQFGSLLGGASAAKQRVAELVQFTAKSKLFPLEDVGAASRELETLTRGVFSNTEALGQVQNVAARSGNGITDVASAVGHFYDDLREGRPIDNTTEQLRQMGVISQATANRLNELHRSGVGVQQTFSALTTRLGGGSQGAQGDLVNVERQHGAAAENLKQQFGAPFTKDEIQNTKNWTDAMNAVAPTVGRVSGFFANLVDGLSTFYSWVAKSAAETPALQKALEITAKTIGIMAAAVTVLAAVRLPIVLAGWAAAITGVGVAATTARVALMALSIGSGVLAAVAIVGTAIGVVMNYQRAQQQAAEEARQLAAAHREVQDAIDKQVASMRTLTDWHEAVAKAIANEIKLEEELRDLRAKQTSSNDPRVKEAAKARAEAEKKRKELLKLGPEGLTSDAQQELARTRAQQAIQAEEDAFQAKMTAGAPEGRVAALRERAAVLARREAEGKAGAQAAIDVEKRRAAMLPNLVKAEEALRKERETTRIVDGKRDMSQIEKAEGRVRMVQEAMDAAGLVAPQGSSVALATRAQMMRAGKIMGTPEDAAMLDVRAEMARAFESQTGSRSAGLKAEQRAAERELYLSREAQNRELEARRRERRGDFGEAISLRDLGAFTEEFEANRRTGFSDQEAAQKAFDRRKDDILQSQFERPSVVDSLQRLGLGGNIGVSDPALEVARRQEELLRRANTYLEEIARPRRERTERVVAVYTE